MSESMFAELGIAATETETSEFLETFSGNWPPGTEAMAWAAGRSTVSVLVPYFPKVPCSDRALSGSWGRVWLFEFFGLVSSNSTVKVLQRTSLDVPYWQSPEPQALTYPKDLLMSVMSQTLQKPLPTRTEGPRPLTPNPKP